MCGHLCSYYIYHIVYVSYCICIELNMYRIVLYSLQGDTPLMLATKHGMMDIVKLLLDCGADGSRVNKVNAFRT